MNESVSRFFENGDGDAQCPCVRSSKTTKTLYKPSVDLVDLVALSLAFDRGAGVVSSPGPPPSGYYPAPAAHTEVITQCAYNMQYLHVFCHTNLQLGVELYLLHHHDHKYVKITFLHKGKLGNGKHLSLEAS